MSGFLRRVSAQARGLPSAVRSATQLPFAGAPMLMEPSSMDTAASMPARLANDDGAPATHDRRDSTGSSSPDRIDRNRGSLEDDTPAGLRRSPDVLVAAIESRPASNPSRSSAAMRVATGDAPNVDETQAADPPREAPPPLIAPRTRTVSVVAPVAPASARSKASQAAPDGEPHEVHVSIGSIEITAIHEAPAPRRAPSAKTAPKRMSLDDYLARRQGARE